MDETQRQIAEAARKAVEHPGQVGVGYSDTDREYLRRLADEHERRAAEYRTLAMEAANVSTVDVAP